MLLSPRYLPRLAAMVGLFTRYGLRDLAQTQGLQTIAPGEVEAARDDESTAKRAEGFRKRLVELGPAYIKLGQVLSTRPDLIPPSYIAELEKLQDSVDPLDYDVVERCIQEELGAKISKLFSTFEREPLGSASLGQVHAAELRDGRPVVVKVQRPGIREQLADDIEFFQELAGFLAAHTKAGERVDLLGIIHELERSLTDELDYRVEARNAVLLRRALTDFPHILIPRVIEGYSTAKVITTERIRGIKVNDIPPMSRAEHDFSVLADEFAKAYLKQITIDGHFHADPHPGNVFVVLPRPDDNDSRRSRGERPANPSTPAELAAQDRRSESRPAATRLQELEVEAQRDAPLPAPMGEPRLALIDFGMTARLSAGLRDRIVRFLLAVSENRGDVAAEALMEMGETMEGFDRGTYMREIASLISRNYDLAIGELNAGRLMFEINGISFRSGLRLPAELTLLAKALFNLDAVTGALDPLYSPLTAIRDFGDQLAQDRARRELSPSRIFQTLAHTSDLMQALPHRIDTITARLAANELGVRVETPAVDVMLEGLQKIANRILAGLVVCGLLVASAMLIPHRMRLGTIGFIIAAVIGVYLVITILVSDRHERRGAATRGP